MQNLLDLQINSERLILIPTSLKSAREIFQEFTGDITRYMSSEPYGGLEGAKESINKWREKMRNGEDLVLDIFVKKTKEFLGRAILIHIKTGKAELGIWIKKSAHGNHYGKEAVTALKEWADKEIPYEYLYYPVDKRNIASRRIPESLGGIIKAEYKKNISGKILDEVEYRIYPTK